MTSETKAHHNVSTCNARPHRPSHAHPNPTRRWPVYILPIAGLLSLIWFLLRVIPKPSRATYPCQRVAMPMACGFVAWLAGLAGSIFAFRKAKALLGQSRTHLALLVLALAVVATGVALTYTPQTDATAATVNPLSPIGQAKGIYPGRVVWVHDPDATTWNGPGDGHWWQAEHTDQAVVDQMLSDAMLTLTGEHNSKAAWEKLLRHHNKTNAGYTPGQKIAMKVNFVGLICTTDAVDPRSYQLKNWVDYMNTSPQVIIAVLRQLVNDVGVSQSDISIFDSLAYIANEYHKIITDEFPDVRFVDRAGKFGRIRATQSDVRLHWSCNPTAEKPDYVPACFAEAAYIINLANLKAHPGAGVTLCAKNHYGSLLRLPPEKGYYDMHETAFGEGYGRYHALVDLMGHAHIGGKTVLYLIDGLYAGIHYVERVPRKWTSEPFKGDWTSSLFASQDPVAIDSVGVDFLQAEYTKYAHKPGVDDYLREAALADNPPSRTFYDPDHQGNVTQLASLGVHEHWNNAADKKYSRNLGLGDGIELIAIGPDSQTATSVVAPGAKLEKLADGFRFTEGPAADSQGNVFFTDQPNNKILKWSLDGKLSTFHDSPGRANGLYFDRKGNLYACADLNNELWMIDPTGQITVLVKDYDGKKLNGPNDLWIDPKGGIYFTDPFYKRPYWDRGPIAQDGQHVYYLSPDRQRLTRVIDDLKQPNGIIGTADGKLLYVADIGDSKTYVYTINDDAMLSDKKLIARMGSDGMTLDDQGNLYLTGKGVTVFNARGRKIDHIDVPEGWTANVTFGGKDRHTLFITASDSLYAIRTRVKGQN